MRGPMIKTEKQLSDYVRDVFGREPASTSRKALVMQIRELSARFPDKIKAYEQKLKMTVSDETPKPVEKKKKSQRK